MSGQHSRAGRPGGRRGLWCVVAGVAITAGAATILIVGPGGGEARAQQENLTLDEVLDRVEEARSRITSVSYLLVSNTQRHHKPDQSSPDHTHRTMDVLEHGEMRRSRTHLRHVFVGRPDQDFEHRRAAVVNDHAIGIRRATTNVWDLTVIDDGNPAWSRLAKESPDYLSHGFGAGWDDVGGLRALIEPHPGWYGVRAVQRDGRAQIEVRPTAWDDPAEQRSGLWFIVDPERGYLITQVRNYYKGSVISEFQIEPALVEDEAGGQPVWFPRHVEWMDWLVKGDGDLVLRAHTVRRFEDVRINPPIADDAFSLPVALEWETGGLVVIWDDARPREYAWYRDGELVGPAPVVFRQE